MAEVIVENLESMSFRVIFYNTIIIEKEIERGDFGAPAREVSSSWTMISPRWHAFVPFVAFC
jgi:hypothetical protein